MADPRPGPYLSDVLAGKDPRDVLADRIQTWAEAEDWHVYDYVDRLIADLDAAGCNPEDVADLRAENERLRGELKLAWLMVKSDAADAPGRISMAIRPFLEAAVLRFANTEGR